MRTPLAQHAIIIGISSISILIFILIISFNSDFTIAELMRDVTTTAGVHPIIGILSNLGALLWCASGTICLFSAVILRKTKPKKIFWFLLSSSLLSYYLLFDDFFLFHEYLVYAYLGLNERFVYLVLTFSTTVYIVVFNKIIMSTRYLLLLFSFFLFSISIFVDIRLNDYLNGIIGISWRIFFEDGSKWLGIVFWLSYYADTSFQLVANSQNNSK